MEAQRTGSRAGPTHIFGEEGLLLLWVFGLLGLLHLQALNEGRRLRPVTGEGPSVRGWSAGEGSGEGRGWPRQGICVPHPRPLPSSLTLEL